MKRLLLLGFAFLGLVLSIRANAILRDKTYVSRYLPVDTNTVKNGNDNLFLASIRGTNGALLNPRAIVFVRDFMSKNRKDLEAIRSSGHSYLRLIDGILSQYGLPSQLKYLAFIESELKPTAVSCVGAAGPWQLMPGTARLLGLKVNRRVDERKNYRKSTQAAAIYLRDLYAEFGDWLLVIAAYNGGDGNVYRAIKRSHSTNFWDLQYYLPKESRNHVKKFIGTQYTLEGQGSVTTLTKKEAAQQLTGSAMYVFSRKINKAEDADSKMLTISGKYYSSAIARNILMDTAEFNRYNPDFDKVMASNNKSYELKLPADKMDLFVSDKYQILNESMQYWQMEENNSEDTRSIAGNTRR